MIDSIAVIAGGFATRLYPITKKIPKSLIEVAGKPFILHQIELFKKNNISDAVLCLGNLGEQIVDVVGDGKKFGLNVSYSFDGDKPLGTGGAILKALPYLKDDFFVIYGDSYLDIDFKAVAEYFYKAGKPALMTVFKNINVGDKSNVVFRNGEIIVYDKKNISDEMDYIDYGLGVFNKKIFDYFLETETLDLAVVYQTLLSKKLLAGYEINKRFYQIGTKEGILETENYLKNNE